jgi:hypothetical protein
MTPTEIQVQLSYLESNNNIRVSQYTINKANQEHTITVATNQIDIAKQQIEALENKKLIDDATYDNKRKELIALLNKS